MDLELEAKLVEVVNARTGTPGDGNSESEGRWALQTQIACDDEPVRKLGIRLLGTEDWVGVGTRQPGGATGITIGPGCLGGSLESPDG